MLACGAAQGWGVARAVVTKRIDARRIEKCILGGLEIWYALKRVGCGVLGDTDGQEPGVLYRCSQFYRNRKCHAAEGFFHLDSAIQYAG
jgi:hypothetical protein